MKKIFLMTAVAFSLVFTGCKDKAAAKIDSAKLETAKERDAKIELGAAVIEFDQREYDFGEVVEGDSVEGVFKVTNAGKSDLVITSAKATCGCTVPEWPKDAIKPGESADIKFTFNSRGRQGKQTKSITLKTNTEKITEILRIKGTVIKKS